MGGVPRDQKMLKGHLPRVMYHQVYEDKTQILNPKTLKLQVELEVAALMLEVRVVWGEAPPPDHFVLEGCSSLGLNSSSFLFFTLKPRVE